MSNDRDMPDRASNTSKAEGERDRAGAGNASGPDSAGITNRPIEEEVENQNRVPERGESREGAHAGPGDRRDNREDQR